MAFWLIQAQNNQDERYFLENSCICCLEENLTTSMLDFYNAHDLTIYLEDECQVDFQCAKNWCDICWPFAHNMNIGDFVALFNLDGSTIHYGRVTSDYSFDEQAQARYVHKRNVVWFERGVLISGLTDEGHMMFDRSEQVCQLDGHAFMNTVIAAYKYAIPQVAAERLVFNGNNADEIFALTIDTNGSSPERVTDPARIVAPKVEAPKTNVDPVVRGASATAKASAQLLDNGPKASTSAQIMQNVKDAKVAQASQVAAHAAAAAQANDSKQALNKRLADIIQQKVLSKELSLTNLIENIIRAKGFATKIRPESNARNTTLIASSTKNHAVKVSVQIQNYDKPLSAQSLEFLGQMMKFYSTGHAVLVSLSGFEQGVLNQAQANNNVKLWSCDDIANEVLACYDKLDANIRASLPRAL